MKILTSLSMVAGLAIAGGAAAQSADQSSQATVAQAAPAAPLPPAAADAAGNPAGNTPTVPDQAQAPASGATAVATTITNGPVPDTAENRAKYGGPMSHTGKKTKPAGN
jgi:hypothetical protein